MKIAIGNDHAGLELKTHFLEFLRDAGHTVEDVGTYDTESVDYPDFAAKVAACVRDGAAACGILICKTGVGVAIAANKVSGVRAATVTNEYVAQMSREHNDANVLCLGAQVLGVDLAERITERFLAGAFLGGRHERRLDKIQSLEDARGGDA